MSANGPLEVLARRRRAVLFTFLLAMALVLAGIAVAPRRYLATATLRLSPTPEATGSYRLDVADRLMNTFATLATTGPILDELRQRLGTPELPTVRVEMPANTELMRIVARHADPDVAARAANELASILVARSRRYPGTETASPLAFSVVEAAVPAATPSLPNARVLFPAGVAAALLCAVAAGYLLERVDPAVYAPAQLAAVTDAPLLAHVPALRTRRRRKKEGASAAFREAFRYLTVAVKERLPVAGGATVLVTGCSPGDGASTVAANLATTAAGQAMRTLLIDCNLRRPALHERFGVSNETGLSTVLSGGAEAREVVRASRVRDLSVLPSGPAGPQDASLVDTAAMRELLRIAVDHFDLVVLDAASMADGADAVSLAANAGFAALVVRRGRVRRDVARSCVANLEAAGNGAVGVVMNG